MVSLCKWFLSKTRIMPSFTKTKTKREISKMDYENMFVQYEIKLKARKIQKNRYFNSIF